jgi:hypothetical protein
MSCDERIGEFFFKLVRTGSKRISPASITPPPITTVWGSMIEEKPEMA